MPKKKFFLNSHFHCFTSFSFSFSFITSHIFTFLLLNDFIIKKMVKKDDVLVF